jgi:hypothetical protein
LYHKGKIEDAIYYKEETGFTYLSDKGTIERYGMGVAN